MRIKPIERFEKHERFFKSIVVNAKNECWEWMGYSTHCGYGLFSIKSTVKLRAHRVSWSIFKGDPNPLMVIDHICRNRKCVNPDHLREVTQGTNATENSTGIPAINKQKTHCKYGHEFTPENTKLRNGGRFKNTRECHTCIKARIIKNKERL